MRQSIKNRIRYFVTFNRVTIFVAKLCGMISNFKNGEYVCLKHDKSKKFYVVSNIIIEGKIQLGYFSDFTHRIEEDAYIKPSKLEYSVEEVYRRHNEIKGVF